MSNEEQQAYWDGEGGKRWARDDAIMARMLEPVTRDLLNHAAIAGSRRALDIGCGGGSQTLLLAERLGNGASVLGMDISGPMLEVAQGKIKTRDDGLASVAFELSDASQHRFEPDSFDLLFSRFGVMFFDNPEAAFTNIRTGARDAAHLAFCCWQSVGDNPWVSLAMQAALQHVPPPEAPAPHAPGPFAFADSDRLKNILESAGFNSIDIQSYNSEFIFSRADTLAQSVRDLAAIGPVSGLLAEQGAEVRETVYAALEDVLAPYYQVGALSLPVAIWFVTGRAA